MRLKDEADAAGLRRQRNAACAGINRQAFKFDFAVIGPHRARKEIGNRRLPGTRFASKHINAALKVELSLKREAAKRLSESGLQHLGNSLPQQKNVAIPNMNNEKQL